MFDVSFGKPKALSKSGYVVKSKLHNYFQFAIPIYSLHSNLQPRTPSKTVFYVKSMYRWWLLCHHAFLTLLVGK
jgi:hypothetical protein